MFQVVRETVPEDSFYYNAPKHLVLTSPYFSLAPVGLHSDREMDDDEYEAKVLAREEALAEAAARREAEAEARRDERVRLKAIRDAEEKEARARKSEENKRLAGPRKERAKEVWLDTTPVRLNGLSARERTEKQKKRSVRSRREQKMIHRPKPRPGYVPIKEAAAGMTIPGLIIAIRKGAVPAEKLQRQWYVDKALARAYIESSDRRKHEQSLVSLAKARAVRFGERTA